MALIEVSNLVKDYKINKRKNGIRGAISNLLVPEYKMIRAVNDIGFSIEKGEMVGFIGSNGAGKSTTVKMLTGILIPTSGSIDIGGVCPYKDRKRNAARMGVVFGQRTQMWYDLPVIDTFDLLKFIYKIPEAKYKENIALFSKLLGLDEFMHQSVRQLSLGQRMRADIAASLLHDPEIVLFDEPTIGLDVVAKERIREFIKQMNRQKETTMLFTTHDMQDIERTCNRMIIIDKGMLIYQGSIKAIKDSYGKERSLVVEFERTGMPSEFHLSDTVKVTKEEDNKIRFTFDKEKIEVSKLITELAQKYDVLDLTIQEPNIESIVRQIYERGI